LIRAVLFDAHGTLIELAEPLGETYARIAGRHGVEVSAWRIADAFRRVLAAAEPAVFPNTPPESIPAREREWWRRLVRSAFRAADDAQRFADFDACFAELFAHFARPEAWRARAGAAALLDRLHRLGLATAVVSNFDHRLPGVLAGLGLLARLDAVVLASDAGAAKPDARAFAVALHRLGVAPAEALFVGDDAARDLDAARRAGLSAVDVASLATLDALEIPGHPT
jgi:putative hydrolase of the HAD superfamily